MVIISTIKENESKTGKMNKPFSCFLQKAANMKLTNIKQQYTNLALSITFNDN
jgi:hypothetical protein